MTVKKEICIGNGKLLTLHEKEEELTKNQKMKNCKFFYDSKDRII